MGDEKRENALLVLAPRRQNFRVPLNAENPSMLGALDAFDDAVLGDGVGHQTAADFFHRLMMGGKKGVILTVILGIIGAVVGGFLAGTVLNVADVTGINVESVVDAVIGAVIVVAVYRFFVGRRTAV